MRRPDYGTWFDVRRYPDVLGWYVIETADTEGHGLGPHGEPVDSFDTREEADALAAELEGQRRHLTGACECAGPCPLPEWAR